MDRQRQGVSWSTRTFYYSGYHLAQTEIRSPEESVALLGFPVMVGSAATRAHSKSERRLATEWRWSREFDRVERLQSALERLYGENEGIVDEDWCLRDPPSDPDELSAMEEILPVKAEVCAIGTYDTDRRAFVPGPGPRNPIRVFVGTGEEAAGSLLRSGAVLAASGALATFVGLAVLQRAFF